ncbi:hypothetical protein P4637_07965 [Halalkalibacterium halodurans]|jgi:predicted DNA-binding transcriptional regulator YafY|uniref:BH1502 protein n=2 Tax=Halalkalibacterium halodurans TaxID=86665 RepID=Q9KCR7_HALH5|nr:hypothetical protein [Halalkalibacterium halodurans]MDY7222024.1 hypothetical protein [Halalkalibacterium halodurans]MDY7241300.1 hypothetical protein [Halalkalibacterium halodurans]MED3648303.1 hypothetical protein [Halalkalibacterium halodurans]MED4082912.1 hypothetical protein [Halalkalibacterium halodurans]MED4084798.1 hypothetical protein [Halalkalibacterium halodurans]
MEKLLRRSVQEQLILAAIYQSCSGEFTQRKLLVKSFNDTHVVAYCFLRKQTRMFKRDHFLSVQPDHSNVSRPAW